MLHFKVAMSMAVPICGRFDGGEKGATAAAVLFFFRPPSPIIPPPRAGEKVNNGLVA